MVVDVDYDWLLRNKRFFSNLYRGKYIAVVGREIVGIGKTIQEAYEDAKNNGKNQGKTPVLIKVTQSGEVELLMGMAGG